MVWSQLEARVAENSKALACVAMMPKKLPALHSRPASSAGGAATRHLGSSRRLRTFISAQCLQEVHKAGATVRQP